MTSAVEAIVSPHTEDRVGSVRVGLLGLGNVGSAFVRLAEDERERLRPLGLSVGIAAALVRSTSAARRRW